jgi:hypothetical protein
MHCCCCCCQHKHENYFDHRVYLKYCRWLKKHNINKNPHVKGIDSYMNTLPTSEAYDDDDEIAFKVWEKRWPDYKDWEKRTEPWRNINGLPY